MLTIFLQKAQFSELLSKEGNSLWTDQWLLVYSEEGWKPTYSKSIWRQREQRAPESGVCAAFVARFLVLPVQEGEGKGGGGVSSQSTSNAALTSSSARPDNGADDAEAVALEDMIAFYITE
jgi:hypothetical protein